MKKKNFILFFYLPLVGIIIIFFILSSVNRRYIKNKVEDLVNEQLYATAEILKVNISYFLEENYTTDEIFELYSGEDNIYYMALIDEKKQILGWISRFEGYLPLSIQSRKENESWLIDSPAGKIFNIFFPFDSKEGNTYFLYLGYSMENLEEMIAHSRRSFFIVFGVIVIIGIIFFLGLFQLQNYYLEKEMEAEKEKKEKDRFREISAFTSGVAHEIKNPLNSLSLLFELLQKKSSSELKTDVLLGKKEILKISRIIDQFSAAQKPLKLRREKFFIEEIMQDIRASFKNEIDQRKNEMQYSQTSRILLHADKQLITQAFVNLLKNSLEATSEGEITIRARQHRKTAFITVSDSGQGITEEEQKYIFYPFFTKKEKGMGIGLYLTKKIIEAHGGKIEFQSEIGRGTTFSIQIPGGKNE